jgi:hypothetical protein
VHIPKGISDSVNPVEVPLFIPLQQVTCAQRETRLAEATTLPDKKYLSPLRKTSFKIFLLVAALFVYPSKLFKCTLSSACMPLHVLLPSHRNGVLDTCYKKPRLVWSANFAPSILTTHDAMRFRVYLQDNSSRTVILPRGCSFKYNDFHYTCLFHTHPEQNSRINKVQSSRYVPKGPHLI